MVAKMSIVILILFVNLALGQAYNIPAVQLKTLDERTVVASSVIRSDELTLVYFFDETSRDLNDHFEYLEALSYKYTSYDKVKIIAIYNASSVNYAQLRPFLEGNSIELETYIDLNGEFQRIMGLPAHSAYLVCEPRNDFSYYYTEAIDYNIDLISREIDPVGNGENTALFYNQRFNGNQRGH
jgi:hypothetical protein